MVPQRVEPKPRKNRASKGGGRVAPKGGGAKMSRFFFFSVSCLIIRSFLPTLGVFSWNFGGVFEAPGPSNVHV